MNTREDSTPEVSVVLGVRNGGDRVAAAVRSILGQRNVDLELIVVDDGSTDGTPATLAAFATADSRVRVATQQPAGLTAALARGCAEARAPFIARHDADEVSHPDRLRRQLDAISVHTDVVLVSCWTAYLAPNGELVRVEKQSCECDRPIPMFDLAAKGKPVSVTAGPAAHGSVLFPTELYRQVGGYRSAFTAGQDWDLWLRIGQHGKFLMIGDVLLSTTLEPRSISFAVRDLQLALGETAREALRRRLAGESEAEPLARAELLSRRLAAARRHPRRRTEALGLYHIGEQLRRQRHPSALGYLLQAVRRYPFLLRGWVRVGQALARPPRTASGEPWQE